MSKPRCLDLFCGAGGAARGLQRAGFYVVGVDIKPQPRYAGDEFHQGDALTWPLEDFDLIWASPPCQGYSLARNNGSGSDAPRLIPEVRALLSDHPLTVIENVQTAPLVNAVMLCGQSFGLGAAGMDLPRHRWFECSFAVMVPVCAHRRGQTMGVYGNGTNAWHRAKLGRGIRATETREAMGIDWMTRRELNEAIPPPFSEWIGTYALMALSRKESA